MKYLENENEKMKNANYMLKKNIKQTKQQELQESNKIYDIECKRLRYMIEEMIVTKHINENESYKKLKYTVISQNAVINEQKNSIEELKQELELEKIMQNNATDTLKKIEEQHKKNKSQKEKMNQQKIELQESQEKISILINQVKELEDKLKIKRENRIEGSQQPKDDDVESKMKNEILTLRNKNQNLMNKLDENKTKIMEREK